MIRPRPIAPQGAVGGNAPAGRVESRIAAPTDSVITIHRTRSEERSSESALFVAERRVTPRVISENTQAKMTPLAAAPSDTISAAGRAGCASGPAPRRRAP